MLDEEYSGEEIAGIILLHLSVNIWVKNLHRPIFAEKNEI